MTVYSTLEQLADPRKDKLLEFHNQHLELMEIAKGSAAKHQAWPKGYLDHLYELFSIAEMLYPSLDNHAPDGLDFSLESATVVFYFHDVEKIWKYSIGLPQGFDKEYFYTHTLPEVYGIVLTEAELHALKYIHGEGDDYCDKRVMSPFAAFCHCVDTLSARMFFAEGKGKG